MRDTPCSRVVIDPGNPRIILVTESMRLLRSTDRGTTWTEVFCRCQIGTFATFTSLVFDGDAVYAAAQREYKGSGGVFRSTDTGASWSQVAGQSFTSLSVDSGALVATRESGVARSADRGETWTGLYPGKRYVSTVAVGPSGTLWAGAISQCSSSWGLACPKVGGGVLSSHDGGATWESHTPRSNDSRRAKCCWTRRTHGSSFWAATKRGFGSRAQADGSFRRWYPGPAGGGDAARAGDGSGPRISRVRHDSQRLVYDT